METPGATPSVSPSLSARGWRVTVVDETGSTNADLLAAAASGAPHRSVLMARHQTAGRGRLDRTWEAPAGANLLVSVLLRELPAHPHELTQRLALAAVQAAEDVAGVHAALKWPNDLLVGDAKLAGILAQAGGSVGAAPDHVVVGIGMNVRWAPPGAAKLGDDVDPFHVLRAMLVAFDGLPADVHESYRSRLATLGRQVKVVLHDGELHGRAVDVGRDGRLAVLDDCAITHHLDTGDVVHLRPG
jgi:BirA family biotin operon repressor/biotin-[acetyl-CoA-carboxylase] ligase